MTLTTEQKTAVANWIAAGDTLADVQKKLAGQFNLTLTYMDVRFIVDDLDLTLKDPAPPPVPSPEAGAQPPAGGAAHGGPMEDDLDNESLPPNHLAQNRPSPYPGDPSDDEDFAEDESVPAAAVHDTPPLDTNVRVELDSVTVIPNAVASGSVIFTDGVTGKWFVDNYGRPGFTQISQPDYRPTQADAQAFMQELSAALQNRGF
ncbi:hypothetical protein M2447_000465 [Ereboglobus sp. PH5-10]|uniref:hypothetical protein n=1 Tax=Ereboglobus sp. PH5-10 TaxID=2940629 RepID=UPI00240514EB|nr:hypothetical protein [Ereboglobus sp. PH5-10]MDF9826384.1 hypothetical protein [Ereboglobus sp. PH5-10]